MSPADAQGPVEVKDLLDRSVELRRDLMAAGARVDALGSDTSEGMTRCFEAGLNAISVPRQYGGISDGSVAFAAEATIEICTNLCASDGALGQNWGVSQLVAREIFHAGDLVPEATKRQLADEILNKGVRFVASNSEAGSPQTVVSRKVEGGVRVSGVKTFNSNSGGGGYASVGHKLEGFEGRYIAIVPLEAEGVRQHHDWDNMGQRGTYSQTITYDDVFVPDGWHYPVANIDLRFLPFAFLIHTAILLGSAMGALDTGLEHLRSSHRVLLNQFAKASDDPLMMRRLGGFSAKVRAAHILQLHVSRELEAATGEAEPLMEIMVDAFRNKSVCLETSLEVTEGLFDLTGARTTANKFRFDRFWRNARTFAVHDPLDVLQVWIGGWDLERKAPNFFAQFRV